MNNKKSIYTTLAIIIVSTVLVIQSITLIYNYKQTQNTLKDNIIYNSNASLVQLKNTITQYIETYSINEYERALKNEMEHQDILAIVVENNNMSKMLGVASYVTGKIRDDNWNTVDYYLNLKNQQEKLDNAFYVKTASLTNESGSKVGNITIYSSDRFMKKELNKIVSSSIYSSLFLSIILILILFFAIYFFTLKPINNIIDFISKNTKDGIPNEELSASGSKELVVLSSSINTMIQTIKKSQNELKDLNENLNDKVKEKTQEQNLLLSLFDIGDSVLFKWNNDENWSVDYVSKSIKKLLGYEAEEFLEGKIAYASCVFQNDLETVLKEVKENSKKGVSYFQHKPYRLIDKEGNIKWVLDYTVIIKDEKGNITHYIGYLLDISEQKEKDKLLFEQSKMASMGEMIGNIAHQWRQPLSAISSTASGMKVSNYLNLLSNEEIEEQLDTIVRKTEYLSDTINTFRNFIKDDKETKNIILEKLIQESIHIIAASLNDYYIKLIEQIDYDKKTSMMMVPSELPQVLINIINNAKDALINKDIQDKWIKLKLEKQSDKVIITIEDNAKGIPEDIIDHIFEPYFTTKHQSQGTGLGLHMSQKIVVDSLKGKIYVNNTQNGAKFTIELPIS